MPESEPCTTLCRNKSGDIQWAPPHQSIPLLQGQPIDNSPTTADINVGCRPCHDRGAEKKNKQTSSYPNMESVWPITDPNQLISNRPAQRPPTPQPQNRRSDKATQLCGLRNLGIFFINHHQISLVTTGPTQPSDVDPSSVIRAPQLASRDTQRTIDAHVGFV